MTAEVQQRRLKFHAAAFLKVILAGLLAVCLVAIIILCWVPPVSRDALTHHLAVPKLYLEHGGIYEIPSIIFSYYPMNLDLLYMVALYFGSDIAAKYMHFSFALLSAWLVFWYLKRRLGSVWGMLGSLMFVSLPLVVKLSITVYVDLGLIFFSTAALLFYLRWIEKRYRLTYLILAALFCGLALGTKYNGLVVFFLLALFVPFIYSRKEAGVGAIHHRGSDPKNPAIATRALAYAGLFIFTSLLVYSPWMIRNWVWTHNPVYPLYRSFFNSQQIFAEENSFETAGENFTAKVRRTKRSLSPLVKRRVLYNESWWQVMLVPLRIFFQGKDNNPQFFDGRLNLYLLILPFFAVCFFSKDTAVVKTEKLILFAFAGLYLSFTFFKADMRVRYIAPIIPPLVILSVYGLHGVVAFISSRYSPRTAGWGLAGVVTVAVLLWLPNVFYVYRLFNVVDPFSYIGGRLTRDAYIEKHRPEYPVLQYANSHLDHKDKILGLFIGKRRYYSDREIIFDMDLFRRVLSAAPSAETAALDFRRTGVTHLLVRYDIFNNWSRAVFTVPEREKIRDFFKANLNLLFSKGGYGLYQLKIPA